MSGSTLSDYHLVQECAVSDDILVTRDATNHPILPPCDDENTRVGDMRLLLTTYLNELWGKHFVS